MGALVLIVDRVRYFEGSSCKCSGHEEMFQFATVCATRQADYLYSYERIIFLPIVFVSHGLTFVLPIIGRFRDGLPVLKIRLNRRKKLDGLFGEERYSRDKLRTVRTAGRNWKFNVCWTAQLTNTLSSNSTVQTKF